MVSEKDKYRFSSLTEVLCFLFSGIEFHNVMVDGIEEFCRCRFYGMKLLVQKVCVCDMDF